MKLHYESNVLPLLHSAKTAYPEDVEPQIYAILERSVIDTDRQKRNQEYL